MSIEFERPDPTVCGHENEETDESPEGELDVASSAIADDELPNHPSP
jgi:hypothetical protein